MWSKFAVTPAIALCNVSIHFSKEKTLDQFLSIPRSLSLELNMKAVLKHKSDLHPPYQLLLHRDKDESVRHISVCHRQTLGHSDNPRHNELQFLVRKVAQWWIPTSSCILDKLQHVSTYGNTSSTF